MKSKSVTLSQAKLSGWPEPSTCTILPRAAVPVTVKMPEPITAPIPNAVRLHGPRERLSFFSGSSLAAIRASMLFLRKILIAAASSSGRLALALALRLVTNFLLHRPASHTGGALGFGRGLLTGGALHLLTFDFIFDVLGIHQFLFNPAYFSTSFLRPTRGKLTVILASSPSPSRFTTVPVPYFGCSTVMPVRATLRTAGTAAAGGLAAAGREN